MEIQKSKVYVLLDEKSRVLRCEGGYTMSNIDDVSQWTCIDEGTGDRYNLCQSNYFDKPLMTMDGAYRYKLVDGQVVECTPEEIAAQEEANKPEAVPSTEDRLKELESQNQMLMECLLEMSETVYA